ncbi:MAG: PadR family transcriptional regulator [Phycisphaerae bacterium]
MKPRPTTLDYALLGLLNAQPMSGYDVRKLFKSTPMSRFSSSPGSIYPVLKRLERWGWLSGRVDKRTPLRPRKILRITAAGRTQLKQWLTQAISEDDIVHRLEDVILRFSYMDGLINYADQIAFLEQFAQTTRSYVAKLLALHRQLRKTLPMHGALSLELGIAGYRTQQRWARRAITVLKQQREGR